ncbi:LysR family transcriptional regulator [Bradyrhizobium prioriisuperbiae]|uniref:LysR family transcriptional regulator n=1 Tax=Bradyrhizobium prioriisuperbiae TaxID=2854389 RepID=UPI0028F047A1|nr:LysR family transcriptional regulator [Bradyrhizobium prioritasuperba]
MNKIDIDQIKLRRLDFSMLMIFRDLVRLQKTTAVAAQLRLSQSAISHALARLREVFADPLFMRRPNGLEPTFRAMELLPKVETILRMAQEALDVPTQFDPTSSTRSFRLAGNDLVGGVITPPLLGLLRREAPGCRVAFQFAVGVESLNALRSNDLDLAIGRIWNLPDDFQATPVFEESFVVVVRKHHPLARAGKLGLEAYLALDHILVSFRGGYWGMVDQALKRRRLKRRVVASVPMFMTAMTAVAQSDLAATVPARLAAKYAPQLGLKVFEAPVKIDAFTISLVRHARSLADPGLDWLAGKIMQAEQG